jgi:hypothetical protein
MYFTVNKIDKRGCVTIGVLESSEKAIDFARKYVETYVKKWDGAVHFKKCLISQYVEKPKDMKHDKHYVASTKDGVEVFKHKLVKTEGYVYTTEEEVDEDIFKICITEVHGIPDRSKNIDFTMTGDAVNVINYDDVLKELMSKHEEK